MRSVVRVRPGIPYPDDFLLFWWLIAQHIYVCSYRTLIWKKRDIVFANAMYLFVRTLANYGSFHLMSRTP